MTYVRVMLAALGCVCICILAGVYWHACLSMADEQTLRHQIIAEDIFDHMESTLAVFVATEEQRPFNHYRYYYVPADQVRGSVALCRSPLSGAPAYDFVHNYFQITPDGDVQSPHTPSAQQLAYELGDVLEDAQQQAIAARNTVACAVLAPSMPLRAQDDAPPQLSGASGNFNVPLGADVVFVNTAESVQGLPTVQNIQNTQNVQMKELKNTYLAARRSQNKKFQRKKKRPVQQQLSQQSYDRLQSVRPSQQTNGVVANDIDRQLTDWNIQTNRLDAPQKIAPVQAINTAEYKHIAIEVQSLQGAYIDDQQMLVYRDVSVKEELYRQGAIIDSVQLQTSLAQDLPISDALRASITLTWLRHADNNPVHIQRRAGHTYAYYHQLAAPFATIGVVVDIAQQPFESLLSPDALVWPLLFTGILCVLGIYMVERTCGMMYTYVARRQDFVSAVSHELKTPLTAIRMHAEMLSDGMVTDEAMKHRYYHIMHAESERLSRLIENVLDVSRLEKKGRSYHGNRGGMQGCQSLVCTVGNPCACVHDAREICAPQISAQGFTCVVECADDLPTVRYERDGLLQALVNIIDNALKFSLAAGVTDKRICITCAPSADGRYICIRIRDFGNGVPARQLAHIFDSFYRGERELTRRTQGAGIGLTLVKYLIEQMGGQVEAVNHAQQGFEMRVFLRVSAGEADAE